MFDSPLPVVSGIVFGSFLMGIVVYLFMKEQISAQEGSFRIKAAVANANLESQLRDIEDLGSRLQVAQGQLTQTG